MPFSLSPRLAAPLTLALVITGFLFLVFGNGPGKPPAAASAKWTCSMCPQFILSEPGKCPKCFMDLIPLEEGALGGSRLELLLSPEAAGLAGIETTIVEPLSSEAGEDSPLAIPATAVLVNLGRHFVFSESDDGENRIFTLREITVAGRDGNNALVASGLDEGEAVVSRGAFRVDSAMQILGKVSLVNLPPGDLADADDPAMEPYQPADRAAADLRGRGVPVDEWFGQYERVRAALALDDRVLASASARALAAGVAGVDPAPEDEFPSLHRDLARAAGLLAEAGTLEAQRDAFEEVTAGMVLLARRYGSPAGGLNLIFCPMAFGGAGAYWLQPQETVDNPYHGLEMPLCGWPVESIPK